MANNKIQVKRTSTSGRTPNTTNSGNTQYIDAGELALNMADGILYSSNGSVVLPIGANNVNVNVSNTITVGNSSVNATVNSTSYTGSANNASYLGGTAAASYVQNTDSRTLSGNLSFTGLTTYSQNAAFDTNVLFVDSVNNRVGINKIPTVNGLDVSGVAVISAAFQSGNGSFIGFVNATSSINGASHTVGTSLIANSTGVYHTGTMNAASYTVGTTYVVNTTSVYFGTINSSSNGSVLSATALTIGNSSVNATVNSTTFTGTSLTANSATYLGSSINSGNSTGIYTTGVVTASGIVSGSELTSTLASGDEGGQINLAKPPNGTAAGGITIDAFQNKLRIFEQGGNARGAYIDLTACANGVGTNLLTGGGGGTGTVTSVDSANGIAGGPITGSGTLYAVAGNSTLYVNASGIHVNLNSQYTWANTQTFQSNISFTGNNLSLVTNTGSIFFAGSSDANWRIGRNTGGTTKYYYTNNTLDIIAANSNLEGVVFGFTGNSYFEIGYAGTFTQLPIYVGNGSVNVSINSTSFSGTANNATNLGGTAAARFVQNTDSRTLSGNLVISGTYFNPSANTILLGNATQRWVISGNSGDFSSTVNAVTSVNSALLSVGTSFIANTTGAYHTGTMNAASLTVGTSTIANSTGVYTGVVNGSSHTVGSNFIANSTAIVSTGFANVTTSVNSALLSVGTSFIANTTGAYHTGTINAASHTVGTSTIANATGVYTGVVNGSSHTVGSSFIANSTAVVSTGFANISTSVNSALLTVGTSFIANTTGAYHTGVMNAATLSVGSSVVANTTRLAIGTAVGFQANGGIGTDGQVLTSNGTTAYWGTISASGGGYYKGSNGTIGSNNSMNNIFRVNANTLYANVTFIAGENGSAAGPIAINSGVILTIETGARVAIV